MTVQLILRRCVAAVCILLGMHGAGHADEAVAVREKHFAISGSTGIELYESIGRNGPKGAIAHTSYTLKWDRRFANEGKGCRLTRARPIMAITYTYPKPGGALPARTRKLWDTFIAGVRLHEQEHGRMIRDMLAGIEASIAGLYVADDPTCQKAKRQMHRMVKDAAEAHRQRSIAYDRVEMSRGGNVHQLILALVNGDRQR